MATEEASEEYRFSIFWNKIIHESTLEKYRFIRPSELNMMMNFWRCLYFESCKFSQEEGGVISGQNS